MMRHLYFAGIFNETNARNGCQKAISSNLFTFVLYYQNLEILSNISFFDYYHLLPKECCRFQANNIRQIFLFYINQPCI